MAKLSLLRSITREIQAKQEDKGKREEGRGENGEELEGEIIERAVFPLIPRKLDSSRAQIHAA